MERELPEVFGVYELNGELLVTAGTRVGRIHERKLEWIANASKHESDSREVTWIGGRYPDAIDVFVEPTDSRTASFEYLQLGQKVEPVEVEGVPWRGTVRLGDSVLGMSIRSWEERGRLPPRWLSLRGPAVEREFTSAQSQGCTPKDSAQASIALHPTVFGATADGTLIAAGPHCLADQPALEIWKPGEKRGELLMLDGLSSGNGFLAMHPAGKDAMWIVHRVGVLEVKAGVVKPLSKLPAYKDSTVSEGALYVSDGRAIHRWDESAWTKVASFNWGVDFKGQLVRHQGRFYRRGVNLEEFRPTHSLEFTAECKTPFVSLLEVHSSTPAGYAHTDVREALQQFSHAKSISLVEFEETSRNLGVIVPSSAVGEALVTYLQRQLDGASPKLICFSPKSARSIEIGP